MIQGDPDYSYRDLEHGQFVQEFKNCVDNQDKPVNRCREQIEEKIKHAESGRFHEMIEATHNQLSAMDKDEIELFAERNPGMMARAKEHGVIFGGARFLREDAPTPYDDKIPMKVTPAQKGEL